MNFKEKLENNIVWWSLAMIVVGFCAGIGAYKFVIEIGKLEVVTKAEINALRNQAVEIDSATRKEALSKLVADKLSMPFQAALSPKATAEKRSKGIEIDDELRYKALRRAVFLNLVTFQGDGTILSDALYCMRRRGLEFPEVQIPRIVSELPRIMAIRLRWLEDVVLPEFHKQLLSVDETAQEDPLNSNVYIVLPKIAWLVNHKDGEEPYILLHSLGAVEEEVDMLKKKI